MTLGIGFSTLRKNLCKMFFQSCKKFLQQSDRGERRDGGAGQQLLPHRNSTAVLISAGALTAAVIVIIINLNSSYNQNSQSVTILTAIFTAMVCDANVIILILMNFYGCS